MTQVLHVIARLSHGQLATL